MSNTTIPGLIDSQKTSCFCSSYVPSQYPCTPEPTIQRYPRRGPCRIGTWRPSGSRPNGQRRARPIHVFFDMPDTFITAISLDLFRFTSWGLYILSEKFSRVVRKQSL